MSETSSGEMMEPRWPEGAIVYHIYPRSFMDSNGDGVGDLAGVVNRLDYLAELGVNAVWLSPFYPSPMADFGYDIADYRGVDRLFGDMADFERLLQAAHERNIRVLVDLVPNHTSDEHAWFKESRQSRDNPKADWYIWREGKDDNTKPPNNWLDALTGRSAWQWDSSRNQYYLHSFHTKQPDLNWSNQAVRDAIKDVMRFWLDHGVDGFRVDAVYWLAKDPLLRDDTPNTDYIAGDSLLYDAVLHDKCRGDPALYAHLSEMAEVLHEPAYVDRQPFMVTEAYPERHNPIADYLRFYEGVDPKVAAPFNFEGLELPWEAGPWRHFLSVFHASLDRHNPNCVASYAFGNHDKPRLNGRIDEAALRSAAVMLLTLPGMIFIYYGDEIGMHDAPIPLESIRDPAANGDPKDGIGRDPERTPMQWSAQFQAGFTTNKQPWLPLATDYQQRNVEAQQANPHSLLRLYQTLCRLRNESSVLRTGKLAVLDTSQTDVLGYTRYNDAAERFTTFINFSGTSKDLVVPASLGQLVLSTHDRAPATETENEVITLQGHEAVIFASGEHRSQ
jgi:alpha-glucosidase